MRLIYLREGYYGSSGYHAEDLAIIVLSNKITLSNAVLPVCVDWSKRYSILNGAIGKVIFFSTCITYILKLRCISVLVYYKSLDFYRNDRQYSRLIISGHNINSD